MSSFHLPPSPFPVITFLHYASCTIIFFQIFQTSNLLLNLLKIFHHFSKWVYKISSWKIFIENSFWKMISFYHLSKIRCFKGDFIESVRFGGFKNRQTGMRYVNRVVSIRCLRFCSVSYVFEVPRIKLLIFF